VGTGGGDKKLETRDKIGRGLFEILVLIKIGIKLRRRAEVRFRKDLKIRIFDYNPGLYKSQEATDSQI